MKDLNISKSGLEFLTKEEGVVLHIYLDQVGKKTIGVGHLLSQEEIASGKFNNGITREQAMDLLKKDVIYTQNKIKEYIKVDLNQNQFDAMVSMIFNTGPGPIATGTLGKLLNLERFDLVPDEMKKWCYGGGKVLPVLQKRRAREAALFQKPVQSANETDSVENVKIIHPNLPIEHEIEIKESNKLELTTWQKIQNNFYKLFKF